MKLLLLSALVCVALSKSVVDVEEGIEQWELFKIEHEKQYESEDEENLRQQIFLDNLKFVKDHNAKYERGEVSFDVAINKFSDLTSKEFSQMMNGLRIPADHKRTGEEFVPDENLELPETVDWRTKGAVTPVKDQGQCGSCWAFSATGSLEGQSFIKTKSLTSLSEQNLVDCSRAQGNEGCNGGLMDYAFKYINENKGIDTESSYPYKATDGRCHYKAKNKGATCSGWTDIKQGSEKNLQQAVVLGPVSIAIDASHSSFQHYNSGVYKECSCSSTELDHGVLAVGYGTAKKGGAYWLVKNSWGANWGMKGYIMMARNQKNQCGVATMASYPNV